MVAAGAMLAAGLAGSGTILLFVSSGLASLAVTVVALEIGFGNTPRQETSPEAAGPEPVEPSDDEVFDETGEPEPTDSEPPPSPPPEPA